MNCLRSVSTGLVSIRYFCGLERAEVSGRPCTRATLWLATAVLAGTAVTAPGTATGALILAFTTGATGTTGAVTGEVTVTTGSWRAGSDVGRLRSGPVATVGWVDASTCTAPT